jgi:signal transduction histidine kinase
MVACANANTDETVSPSCAVITDMLVLQIRPGPAGLLFQPVYPANDPNQLVGFATTSIHWQEVLTSVVPDYVNGLTCVVTTDTSAYTYSIQDGEPQLVGPGDLHDDGFSDFNRSVVLNDFIETGSNTSAVYTLTVYPTEVMFNAFSTNSPVRVSVGFFGVIALCTLLFFLYDFLMRHEAQQRKVILEMKRRFVRFISHEIRTPLNAVSMGLELLESELRGSKDENEDKLTEDDLEFWHNVTVDTKENVNVAVSILNDLLDYDKLETGIMKLELDRVDIWGLVAKTANQFNIQAVNRKIELKITVDKPACLVGSIDVEAGTERELNVVGDDVKLGQVIRNVISNALKFVSTNDGCIEVSVCHVPNGLPFTKPLVKTDQDARPRAGAVQISVKDNGVGLSEEQLALLFNEGVQFDANKLQHGGGSGLGLSIAKGIVEQHGGIILAESEGQGHGTTFIIKIPLYEFRGDEIKQHGDKESIDATNTTVLTEGSSGVRNPSPPKRILVAEDTVSSRRMLIRLLERAGHTCLEAVNGRDAIEAVTMDLAKTEETPGHLPIDIILMDFEMPQIRGPEATRTIRKLGFDGIILGVTGNVLSDDIEFFRDHGADDVLPKPISLASLRLCWETQGQKRLVASRRKIGGALDEGM